MTNPFYRVLKRGQLHAQGSTSEAHLLFTLGRALLPGLDPLDGDDSVRTIDTLSGERD